MVKYKNFGELKEKDFIFSTELNDSTIKQNCVGGIYKRYIINNIKASKSDNEIILTLIYDKSTFLREWTPEKDDNLITIVLPVNITEDKKIIDTKKTGDNKINCIIFSTNIDSIDETISEIVNTLNNRINEVEALVKRLKIDMSNIVTNFSMRQDMYPDYKTINIKPQYQEVITTEAVYV